MKQLIIVFSVLTSSLAYGTATINVPKIPNTSTTAVIPQNVTPDRVRKAVAEFNVGGSLQGFSKDESVWSRVSSAIHTYPDSEFPFALGLRHVHGHYGKWYVSAGLRIGKFDKPLFFDLHVKVYEHSGLAHVFTKALDIETSTIRIEGELGFKLAGNNQVYGFLSFGTGYFHSLHERDEDDIPDDTKEPVVTELIRHDMTFLIKIGVGMSLEGVYINAPKK